MVDNWLTELTAARKPIIGMAHLPALPGTPLYDSVAGMEHVRDWVSRDLEALQGGDDGVGDGPVDPRREVAARRVVVELLGVVLE